MKVLYLYQKENLDSDNQLKILKLGLHPRLERTENVKQLRKCFGWEKTELVYRYGGIWFTGNLEEGIQLLETIEQESLKQVKNETDSEQPIAGNKPNASKEQMLVKEISSAPPPQKRSEISEFISSVAELNKERNK
ncbi:MAG: hypothetical protein SPG61_00870 [Arcanobacterium sp.]|nr:hypothetical protein [Arcanobacterium sp.]